MEHVVSTIRFTRSPLGFGRRNRASTDALELLSRWKQVPGRTFAILEDTDAQRGEPDYLITRLRTAREDFNASVAAVRLLCEELGLTQEMEESRSRAEWEAHWEAYKRAHTAVNECWSKLAEDDGGWDSAVFEAFENARSAREEAWREFERTHREANSFRQ